MLYFIHIPAALCNVFGGALYFVFAYLLLKLFADKILKLEIQKLNIPAFRIDRKWIIIAILLPLIVTGIYLLMPGTFVYNNDLSAAATICVGVFYTGIAAGFVEEMVFRGFILGLFEQCWNKWAAIIVPSVLFGFVHIVGMDFSPLSCLLVIIAGTLVGIMFSLIALESNSIWNSGIVHAIWNIVIVGGILWIGNYVDEYSLFTYVLKNNSVILTGGEFGIEASLVAICAYVAVSLIAIKGKR